MSDIEGFAALIGTWDTIARHPRLDAEVAGVTTYEWGPGGRFVVQRTSNDHELFPDAISVIGPPERGEGLVMEYFDSRGVRRTYGVALEDGVLRAWRDEPGFEQRFEAAIGDEFVGRWRLAEAPGEFADDLEVRYRRR